MGELELGAAAEATVEAYKQLASDQKQTLALAQDNVCIPFLAYVVSEGTGNLLENAVDTLELLATNEECRPIMANTLGVLESLQELADDARYCEELRNQAASIFTCIQFSRLSMKMNSCKVPDNKEDLIPDNNNEEPTTSRINRQHRKNRKKQTKQNPPTQSNKSKSVTLYISGMIDADHRKKIEAELVRVKGLVSIVFDLSKSQATCRIKKDLSIENLATAVAKTKEFEAKQVISSSEGNEKIIDIGCSSSDKTLEDENLPDYLPEENSPIKRTDSAMATAGSLREAASTFISAAAGLLQKSFYW